MSTKVDFPISHSSEKLIKENVHFLNNPNHILHIFNDVELYAKLLDCSKKIVENNQAIYDVANEIITIIKEENTNPELDELWLKKIDHINSLKKINKELYCNYENLFQELSCI